MPAVRKFQVFISSTFEDLEEERRHVIEQVLNMGHIPVGMELFQASNDEQWDYIRRRVDQCDYYVVIVAERYGAVDASGMSYTEKEYRYACERKIPVASLLLSEKARKGWPQAKVQNDRKAELEKFRALCSGNKMIKHWDDAKDLALKATHALYGLISDFPRPGLIPATEAASSGTIEELARLSEENNNLRRQLIAAESSEEPDDRERKIVEALKAVTLSEALKTRLQALGIATLAGDNLLEFFCDLVAQGRVEITNEQTGELIVEKLSPKPTRPASDPQLAADIIRSRRGVGFVMNDRFHVVGLLSRNENNWSVSDFGWKIIRHHLPPEDILSFW